MTVDLSGLVIAGRYRLTRQIGKGGMGTVWVAVQEQLGRDIALKLIRPELVNEARVRERFRREAKLVAQLANPHIVSVIDFGETDAPGGGTTLFIAMELLRGRTLRQRLREGPISPRESAEVVRQIADALVSAHQAGVVHRDLKPDNVMLAESPGRPDTVKLVDFGVAKSLTPEVGNQRLTQTGVLVGTPGYLAPEVVLGDPAGPSADLYSVGVMWFEMLARRQPFAAQTPMALAMMHLTEPAPKLQTRVPSIPAGIATLVDELLRKEPSERPRSAAELVTRVEALLAAGLDEDASPTIEVTETGRPAPFDQTQVQVFRNDTRPDPDTQPSPVPLGTGHLGGAPRAMRLVTYMAAGAALALGIAGAAALLTNGRAAPERRPAPPSPGAASAQVIAPADAGVMAVVPPEKMPEPEKKREPEERPLPERKPASEKKPAPERKPTLDPSVPHEPRLDLGPG